jgi:hypothetical protein
VAEPNYRITIEKQRQTAEGTRLQLVSSAGKTAAVVVSTLMEAWEVVRGGLVADGTVNDVSDTHPTEEFH